MMHDAVLRVRVLDGLEPVGAANRGVGGAAVLDHDQARPTVGVEVLGVADFSGGDEAIRLEVVVEDPIVGLVFVARVHQVGKVAGSELAAWG
jgi:hypothetical protein